MRWLPALTHGLRLVTALSLLVVSHRVRTSVTAVRCVRRSNGSFLVLSTPPRFFNAIYRFSQVQAFHFFSRLSSHSTGQTNAPLVHCSQPTQQVRNVILLFQCIWQRYPAEKSRTVCCTTLRMTSGTCYQLLELAKLRYFRDFSGSS